MSNELLIGILLLAPVVGFIFNGLRFKSDNAILAGTVATGASFVSFLCVLKLFFQLLGMPDHSREIFVNYYNWLDVGAFNVNVSFMVDTISVVMGLVVTGVGTLIHLFSVGYMSHDERPSKYFSYLNLFLFNMLLLILGSNLLVMFVGWEGVGLCSYLLIGFWFKDKEKATAGMKAFIANRIGDAGLMLGAFLLFMLFGSFEFKDINMHIASLDPTMLGMVTAACLLLFVGATGKSAQIPLYVWLPDAMAGPTPVSALIHAATMVTAGVYMIVRLNPLFLASPVAMSVVAIIGAVTAVFAATIGLAQTDIKKVLAYSTVSQLGYMFLACGVGAFGAAMFHLMTHAFFKALMFLGSGSVIHAMHEEQDIRKMGGLKKYLPITHATFFCGWLAIIGTPLFSGFFSKDEILWMAWHSPRGHFLFWFVGLIGAMCTAFYMTRLMSLTFWGKSRVPKDVHPHESPLVMTLPLIILAILAVIGGYVGVPHAIGGMFGIPNLWENWFEHKILTVPGMTESNPSMEWLLMVISVLAAGSSATLAYIFYVKDTNKPKEYAQKFKGLYELILAKYKIDELYEKIILNPILRISERLWLNFDVKIIDQATYKLSDFIRNAGEGAKSFQNGNLQQYAFYMVIGFLVLITLMVI